MVLRRKAEPLQSAAAAALAQIVDELDHAHWLALIHEVLIGHPTELEEPPPERLVLAAVPAEQLGEEPGRLLPRGSLRPVRRNAGAQGVGNLRRRRFARFQLRRALRPP